AARRARLGALDHDAARLAAMSLLERQRELGLHIRAAHGEAAASPRGAPPSEERLEEIAVPAAAEQVPDVAEVRVLSAPALPVGRRRERGPRSPVLPEGVVAASLLGIGEDFVRL